MLQGPADVARFAAGVLLIVLGALLLAEGVASTVTKTAVFFEGVNRGFEFIVGLAIVIVGASLIPARKRPSTTC